VYWACIHYNLCIAVAMGQNANWDLTFVPKQLMNALIDFEAKFLKGK
jgi:hypothetical protein